MRGPGYLAVVRSLSRLTAVSAPVPSPPVVRPAVAAAVAAAAAVSAVSAAATVSAVSAGTGRTGVVAVPAGEVGVTVELHGRMAVITLAGILDAASSHEVSLAIEPLLDSGLTLVVIDVEHAEFADTSGLGVLLRAQRLLGGERGLVLRAPGPSLLRLLDLTGLEAEFPLA